MRKKRPTPAAEKIDDVGVQPPGEGFEVGVGAADELPVDDALARVGAGVEVVEVGDPEVLLVVRGAGFGGTQ